MRKWQLARPNRDLRLLPQQELLVELLLDLIHPQLFGSVCSLSLLLGRKPISFNYCFAAADSVFSLDFRTALAFEPFELLDCALAELSLLFHFVVLSACVLVDRILALNSVKTLKAVVWRDNLIED